MQRFKRLGVFLHDSPADETALAYAGAFASLAGSELVFCVYVREDEDESSLPDVATVKAEVQQKLPATVANITQVEVHRGTGVPEILRTARDDELDLIIVGRRLPSEQVGIGSAFARLARKAPCSVLVVPKLSRPHLERVFVSVDFSEHAKMALEHGVALARASGAQRPQLVVHSNFAVGYGYSKTGMNLAEAVAQREQQVREKLRDFIKDVDTSGFDVELVSTSGEDVEDAVQEVAVARKMDIVLVGSRGVNSVFLLGSTAERVLINSLVPVMVVKKKGETSKVLDALFGTG